MPINHQCNQIIIGTGYGDVTIGIAKFAGTVGEKPAIAVTFQELKKAELIGKTVKEIKEEAGSSVIFVGPRIFVTYTDSKTIDIHIKALERAKEKLLSANTGTLKVEKDEKENNPA